MRPACETDWNIVAVCPECGLMDGEGRCPYDTIDAFLTQPQAAIGGVLGATCDSDDGACEACQ